MYRLAFATLLVGCYSPSYDNCSIRCDTSGCPNSYECDSQLHVCRRPGSTCEPGGDAGRDAVGEGNGGSDAAGDGPVGGLPRCAFVRNLSDAEQATTIFHIPVSPPIAVDSLVVVTLAVDSANGPPIAAVQDQQSTNFTQAKLEAQGHLTSAIYYLPAATIAIDQIMVTWTGPVNQVADISEYHCSSAPTTIVSAGNAVSSSTASTSAGAMTLQDSSLVVAGLAANTGSLPLVSNTGFTTTTRESLTQNNPAVALSAAYGFAPAQPIDVTYSTPQGVAVAGVIVGFAATMLP